VGLEDPDDLIADLQAGLSGKLEQRATLSDNSIRYNGGAQ
jgi:hypothetical protein